MIAGNVLRRRAAVGVALGAAVWAAGIGAAILIAGAPRAQAAPPAATVPHVRSCAGVYQASRLRQLPAPLSVKLEIWDNSDRNLALAAEFTDAMRKAGASVSDTPTGTLRLRVQMVGSSGNGGAGGGGSAGGFTDWGASGGGFNPSGPDMPRNRLLRGPGRDHVTNLMMRAELRATGQDPVLWVATVQCRIDTDSIDDLATDMGTLIGKTLGKTLANQRF